MRKQIYIIATIQLALASFFFGSFIPKAQASHSANDPNNAICITTADVSDAGTFDQVSLYTYKSDGTPYRFQITLDGSGADQNRGATDCYDFTAANNASDEYKYNLKIDGGNAWYLSHFQITYHGAVIVSRDYRAHGSYGDLGYQNPDGTRGYICLSTDSNDCGPGTPSETVRVARTDIAPCSGNVVLYEDSDYGGACLSLSDGKTNISQTPKFGGGNWNDQASSIKVKSGYSATLYENDDYAPQSSAHVSTSNEAQLSPNDWASSVEVASASVPPPPTPPEPTPPPGTPPPPPQPPGPPPPPLGLPNPISSESLSGLINSLSVWLYIFSIPILSLFILYGGFLIVISGGDEEKYSQGIKIVRWGVVGFVVVLLSGAIAAIIRSVLG